jgi:hypothetical protein
VARAATRLRGEGSDAGVNEDDYVHLDDDDDLDADLLTDAKFVEDATKQRAPMASFEMQRRDQSARQLMVAERRATADRLAAV